MGSRYSLLPRWNSILGNKKLFLKSLGKLICSLKIRRGKRGRPPKRDPIKYIELVITKESDRHSLREAEHNEAFDVFNERIDHSVIHYWEKQIPLELMQEIVLLIGSELEDIAGYNYSVMDSTKFSTWKSSEREFHLFIRKHSDTVYPVSISFGSTSPSTAVNGILVDGGGHVFADKWYDDNKTFKVLIKAGYIPIIKPQRTRCSGYWRKKARKLYNYYTYRAHRGVVESPFGSLTNMFGDRLKTTRTHTTFVRIGSRVIAYMVRIYMRFNCISLLVILVIY